MIGLRTTQSILAIVFSSGAVLGTVALAPQHSRQAKKTTTAAAPAVSSAFAHEIAPLVKKYCSGCHGSAVQTAGINVTTYKTEQAVIKGRDVWEKISENVQSNRMPPTGSPQPTPAERAKIANWIESTLSSADCKLKDPGRVTLRRLNREEYNNTIRDLMGVKFRPADDFPSDDVGYGFDNIGDVLSMSPLLFEKYLAAAEKITQAAIYAEDPTTSPKKIEGGKLEGTDNWATLDNGFRLLHTSGEIFTDFRFPKDGDYILRTRAYGQQAGPDPAKMSIRLGGTELKSFDVKAVEDKPQTYETRIHLTGGKRRVSMAFTNDYYKADDPNPKNRDRNLAVEYIEIVGPYKDRPDPMPASHTRIIPVEPTEANRATAARKIVHDFAQRAWRRPVTSDEVDRLVKYVDLAAKQGESFDKGIQLACQAVLVSPNFLFHVELDPAPNNPDSKHPVNDYELASRLSYFLWSTMPDDELSALAAKNKLHEPAVVEAQARRMLKDPKAHALVDNFTEQWLNLRLLANMNPDTVRFPDFNEGLRTAMRKETDMFCEAIIKEDHPVLDFIDGKFTFLNEQLAKHYGISGVKGDEFQRVALTGDQRGGVLTQASVLTVTSNPTRTSPVKRGKWILEQILGTPPPPPPPGVPELKEDKAGGDTLSLRQKMEQHRKDPACASCHARMDPLGFGLENYDAVGAWRTTEGKFAIDTSGKLPNGQTFAGPAKLKTILKSQKTQFVKCFTDKLLTYALGRGLEYYDKCAVNAIVGTVAKDNYRFSAIVTEIVKSDPFRMRRGDGGLK